MFRFLKRLILLLLITLVAGYIAAEVYAAGYAERRIEEEVQEKTPGNRQVEADVSTPLLWGILTRGTVRRIEISMQQVPVGPFAAERTSGALTEVRLDRVRSLRERRPVIASIESMEMTAELTEGEVSRVLPEGQKFRFGDGTTELEGSSGRVRGHLELDPPSSIRFVPDSPVPGVRPIAWTFSDIPLVSCIEELRVEPGRLFVKCVIERPPPEFPAG